MSSSGEEAPARPGLLERLPEEITEMILDQILPTDVQSLALTCKRFHRILTRRLYENLAIVPSRNPSIDVSSNKFNRTYFPKNGIPIKIFPWKYLKDLELRPSGRKYYYESCFLEFKNWAESRFYHDPSRDEMRDLHHTGFLWWLSSESKHIFAHLVKNSLREFRWNLGCCVPKSILGASGYIPNSQATITSLSLVTDADCMHNVSPERLLQLKELRHFSWRGFASDNDFTIFKSVLQKNRNHLATLEVMVHNHTYDPLAVLINLGLLVPLVDGTIVENYNDFRLHSLRHLSLANIPIGLLNSTGALSFDIHKLDSLRLEDCHGTPEFLRSLMQSDLDVNLRTLHVADIDEDPDSNICPSLTSFLESFSGLEELRLFTSDLNFFHGWCSDSLLPFDSHRMTLKRLICQPVYTSGLNQDKYLFDKFFPLWPKLESFSVLECLAFWMQPNFVREQIQCGGDFRSIKLLHFRMDGNYYVPQNSVRELVRSGYPSEMVPTSVRTSHRWIMKDNECLDPERTCLPQLFDFAKWAFGSEGFPNLQVIAYGDFADEQHKWSRILLCRYNKVEHSVSGDAFNDIPFRMINPDIERHLGHIERAVELLREHQDVPLVEGCYPNEDLLYIPSWDSNPEDDEDKVF